MKIIKNGLWGDRADTGLTRRNIEEAVDYIYNQRPREEDFERIALTNISSQLNREFVMRWGEASREQGIQYVDPIEPVDRQINFVSGSHGMRTLEDAFEREINRTRRDTVVDSNEIPGIDQETFNITLNEEFTSQDILSAYGIELQVDNETRRRVHLQRLQRGQITPIEYLDIVSNEL